MAKIGWIDTHTHLVYHDQEQLQAVFEYAKEHGISDIVAIALEKSELVAHNKMKEQTSLVRIHTTLGGHPAEVFKWSEERFNAFMKNLETVDIVAVGEIGLDFYWDKDHHELQKQRFIAQIDLANRRGLPILVHCRDAFGACLEILKQHPPKYHGIMHCYSGSAEMALEFLKVGMDISLAGPLTFKNAKEPKEVAKIVPLDHLHIETDAPYLTPHPFRGKRNQTGFVHFVGEELSSIKNMHESDVINQLGLNFDRIFGKK
jgi:TatD DNase family protein